MWTITKDFIADSDAKPGTNANAVGIVGPSIAKMSHHEIVNHPKGIRFRLYDDDGELYYEGILVGEGEEQFGPLDDFGRPNAGATSIQLFENGVWATL